MSKILVVDGSLQGASLAVADATRPLGDRVMWVGSHPENMGAVAAVARLGREALAAARCGADGLAGLAVATGPGSFTGIKVGLAFAYGVVAGAPGLRCLGLSALECAVERLAGDGFGGPMALFLPATRTHGYWAVAGERGELTRPAALIDVGGDLSALATLPPDGRLTVFGRWPLLNENLKKLRRSATELAPWDVCRAAICGMAERAAAQWPGAFQADLPPPRYLRLSTAEERRQAVQTLGGSP